MTTPISPPPSTFHVAPSTLKPIKAPREADHILKIGVVLDQNISFFDESLEFTGKTPQHIKLDQVGCRQTLNTVENYESIELLVEC